MIAHKISALLLLFSMNLLACDDFLEFSPMAGVDVKSRTEGSNLIYLVSTNEKQTSNRVKFDTVKKLHMESSDFNFDGYSDLAAWHIDDGMGNFSVFRVFIFSPTTTNFTEYFPACGDQFLNLKREQLSKKIISTYFEDNIPALCETHIPASPN
ncbi:hypothetical protein [Pseudomonas leptonychotis]|uniref:hypothetical protein n=1 Tax=Pseudomonas leptonychotis TaxID=2448482 RepID=UPI003869BE04